MFDTPSDPASDFDATVHVLSEFAYANLPRPPTAEAAKGTDTALQERFAPQWVDLLRRAVEEPGLISEAYTRFHGYSLGNRFAALIQCQMRGLEPGPISTFNGWRKLGYAVQEGERALTLCMPIKGILAREKALAPEVAAQRNDPLPDIEEIEYIRAFVWKPHWFVLAQTQPINPETVQPVSVPTLDGWDKDKALTALDIHEMPFAHLDGNTQGYAHGRNIAVSPLAEFSYKTLFHEMAHIVLGHTSREDSTAPLVDTMALPRSQIEVEAEGVTLLLLDTFDLPGQQYSRGYIQHWLEGEEIPEKSAQRIFGGADRILSAGLGEGRVRFPTADDLAWTGTDPAASTVPTATTPVVPVSQASASLTTPRLEPEIGIGAIPAAVLNSGAALPATTALPATRVLSEALTVPDGAEHAWKLHERLMLLHSELHPEERAERHSIARAVGYLERLDPAAATQVRDLVSNASRSLKAAFARLESTLDGDWEEEATAAVAKSLITSNGHHPPAHHSPAQDSESSGVLFAPEPAALPLTSGREATARRVVGRDLRQELREAKKSFFDAAKSHDLKVGGHHQKAMLAALGEFLGVSIPSRRTPTAQQWLQGASAIETEDLLW